MNEPQFDDKTLALMARVKLTPDEIESLRVKLGYSTDDMIDRLVDLSNSFRKSTCTMKEACENMKATFVSMNKNQRKSIHIDTRKKRRKQNKSDARRGFNMNQYQINQ